MSIKLLVYPHTSGFTITIADVLLLSNVSRVSVLISALAWQMTTRPGTRTCQHLIFWIHAVGAIPVVASLKMVDRKRPESTQQDQSS